MYSHSEENYYTDLDRQLQSLAVNDWATFCKLIGEDARMSAKICMLSAQGQSLGQISIKLSVTKRRAQVTKENKCICVIKTPNVTPNVT